MYETERKKITGLHCDSASCGRNRRATHPCRNPDIHNHDKTSARSAGNSFPYCMDHTVHPDGNLFLPRMDKSRFFPVLRQGKESLLLSTNRKLLMVLLLFRLSMVFLFFFVDSSFVGTGSRNDKSFFEYFKNRCIHKPSLPDLADLCRLSESWHMVAEPVSKKSLRPGIKPYLRLLF